MYACSACTACIHLIFDFILYLCSLTYIDSSWNKNISYIFAPLRMTDMTLMTDNFRNPHACTQELLRRRKFLRTREKTLKTSVISVIRHKCIPPTMGERDNPFR